MRLDPHYYEMIVRDRAQDDMTCEVRITRRPDPVFEDPDGALLPGAPALVYEGSARLANTSGPMTLNYADEPQAWQNLYCWIPWDADPAPMVHDVLTVVAARDPRLVGRVYQVEDVDAGGQFRPATMLQLTGTQPSPGTVV